MPQTEVRGPDGSTYVVSHPEGASEADIISYAQRNYAPSTAAPAASPGSPPPGFVGPLQPQPLGATPSVLSGPGYLLDHLFPGDTLGDKATGLAEKAATLGTGAVMTPIAGLAGIGSTLLHGPDAGAETVRNIEDKYIYQPKTAAGQTPNLVEDALNWMGNKAESAGNATAEFTGSPLVGSLAKTAILGAPMLASKFMPKGAAPKIGAPIIGEAGPETAVADAAAGADVIPPVAVAGEAASGLPAETVSNAGSRIVRDTFQGFKDKLGTETRVPMVNTAQAITKALDEVKAAGGVEASPDSISAKLRGVLDNNPGGMTTIGTLDDLWSTFSKIKGEGVRQAKYLVDAVEKDMTEAGRSQGLNFASDLKTARAFSDLYKYKIRGGDLGRIVGQHGKTLQAFQKSDPAGYQDIATDWAGKKLQSFVSTTTTGGKGFNTTKFADWVDSNEAYLGRIVGPETVRVWQAFPKWEGAANFLKGFGQRIVEAKTMGLSKFFSKEIDTKFADGIAQQLTDPSSPLYRALSKSTNRVSKPMTPTGPLVVGSGGANGEVQGQ